MIDWAKRLQDRMAYLGLSNKSVAHLVGIHPQTLSLFLTGQAKRWLQPDQFLRLMEVLRITPNQAFGLEPMAGADPIAPKPGNADFDRLDAHAALLTAENLGIAADLVVALAQRQMRKEEEKAS